MTTDLAFNLVFYCSIAIFLFSTFFFYYKFDKEYKVSFKEKYCKKPASDDPVAAVSFLIDQKGMGIKDIYATIIDLIGRGYLAFSETDGFFISEKDTNSLYPHQKMLMEQLASAERDEDFVTGWKFLATEDASALNYYEEQSFIKKIGIIGSIFYTLIGIVGVLLSHKTRFFLLFVISIITYFHMKKIDRRTREGQTHFEMYMALKRYITDFDGSEPFDETLLPYAYAFGIDVEMNETLYAYCEKYKPALDYADRLIL